jgi:hypothetical protein
VSSFDRRRSDRFADYLEESTRRPRSHRRIDVDHELGLLIQTAGRVSTLSATLAPRGEFRDGLRAMLLTKIGNDGIGATADAKAHQAAIRAALAAETKPVREMRATRHGRARAALLAGVAAGALALSGVSAASTEALPGDPFYQVKRSAERAQLALAGSDQSRGQLYLDFARGRLREARKVTPEHVAAVLADMDAATVSGASLLTKFAVQRADADVLVPLMAFVGQQRERLGELARAIPASADSVRGSLALLDAVRRRATDLTDALATGCVAATVDRLGPKPVGC